MDTSCRSRPGYTFVLHFSKRKGCGAHRQTDQETGPRRAPLREFLIKIYWLWFQAALGPWNLLAGLARMISDHVSDEWLDQYSRGKLEDSRLAQVEEHLLICEHCCARLTKFDDDWGLNG
jgi:hypothetical protein